MIQHVTVYPPPRCLNRTFHKGQILVVFGGLSGKLFTNLVDLMPGRRNWKNHRAGEQGRYSEG